MKNRIGNMRVDQNKANESLSRLQCDLDDLYERHIDLQTRSMRENLIFTGIPMTTQDEESDETE